MYVPQSLLRFAGAVEEDLSRRTMTPEWQLALRTAAGKTRDLFHARPTLERRDAGAIAWQAMTWRAP